MRELDGRVYRPAFPEFRAFALMEAAFQVSRIWPASKAIGLRRYRSLAEVAPACGTASLSGHFAAADRTVALDRWRRGTMTELKGSPVYTIAASSALAGITSQIASFLNCWREYSLPRPRSALRSSLADGLESRVWREESAESR